MRKKIFWLIALLLIGMWAHYVWLRVSKPAMTDEIRAKNGKKFVALSAGVTAYEYAEGDGTPVVLVGGFSMPFAVWDNTFKALKKAGISVLRYDHYGRGFSDRPNVKYNADLFATQLRELTEKIIPGQKFVICGLSMGGAISVYFTDLYAAKVEKMILIAPAGFPMETPATATLDKVPFLGDYFGRLFARRAIEKGMTDSFSTKIPAAAYQASLQQTEYAGYSDAIVSTVRNMNLTKLQETYERVGKKEIPTLVIWGKKDRVVPFANAALVKKSIPHAEIVGLENAGHIPQVDESTKTHAAIREFLGGE
jgi:pimeloyl-ACP methyl ester carboxylesterase